MGFESAVCMAAADAEGRRGGGCCDTVARASEKGDTLACCFELGVCSRIEYCSNDKRARGDGNNKGLNVTTVLCD